MTEDKLAGLIDSKIAAVSAALNVRKEGSWNQKSILESKAMQEVDKVVDAKTYRQWNRKMKNALEQTRTKSRPALEILEKMSEEEIQNRQIEGAFLTKKGAIVTI